MRRIKNFKESSRREAFIFKAKDKNWYYFLSNGEYSEYPDGDFYGPFLTEEEAESHLISNHSNPGGYYVDQSGRKDVPRVVKSNNDRFRY